MFKAISNFFKSNTKEKNKARDESNTETVELTAYDEYKLAFNAQVSMVNTKALEKWINYKWCIKGQKYASKKPICDLLAIGDAERQASAVEYSIKKGYSGIYNKKNKASTNKPSNQQIDYINILSANKGFIPRYCKTKAEASKEIQRLLSIGGAVNPSDYMRDNNNKKNESSLFSIMFIKGKQKNKCLHEAVDVFVNGSKEEIAKAIKASKIPKINKKTRSNASDLTFELNKKGYTWHMVYKILNVDDYTGKAKPQSKTVLNCKKRKHSMMKMVSVLPDNNPELNKEQ
tara:strand:+ start:42 stop:905 length:864 start_codon:yes stop_codon:yes gene_type:complete